MMRMEPKAPDRVRPTRSDTVKRRERAASAGRKSDRVVYVRRSSEVRSAEVWGHTFPRAFRLAHLLVGDRSLAERIAERTFIRLHVRYRDVTGDEGRDRWTLRTVVRLSRSRNRRWTFRRRPEFPADPLAILSFRKRAAYVLSIYEELDAGALAHILDCSPGGAVALLEGAERTFVKAGVEPPTESELKHRAAEIPVPALATTSLKRAARSRAVSSAATVALLLASGFVGAEVLTAPEEPDVVEDIQVPGPRGASDARTDLARFGAPGWCPLLGGTMSFVSQTQGAVGDAAIRFDIALARRGYRQTIDALLYPSSGSPPVHEWPHHESSSGLGVIQVTGGSTDPDLVRSCGPEVAARSIKTAVLQRSGDAAAGEVIAFYMVLVDDAWRVWGSSGP